MQTAIGIVRQSKDNDGDSPHAQRARIEEACQRDGLRLLDVVTELDVSGGTALKDRRGIRSVVERIEAREAQILIASYFDRLFRSLVVQQEIIDRVEAVGGKVLAIDTGQVTNGNAGQWLSGTMLGAFAEDYRRSVKERSGEAQARAVARGVITFPNVPPPLRVNEEGFAEPIPEQVPIVNEALRMRAEGATIDAIRSYLAERGIERSYHGVSAMLSSRLLLGEIHFGELVNLHAFEPVVDPELWRRAQQVRVPRGRRAKSERLLARLGVLRCGSCGARMVVGSAHNGQYALYRCPPTGNCKQRVTISAEKVEALVVDAVKAATADVEGRASAEQNARRVEAELDRAQQELNALIELLDPLEPAARQRLQEATRKRDEARERVEQLGGTGASLTINTADDWDRFSLDAKRALIRATVERVVVHPGRGTGRVRVELVGQ
ncbi:MAG TPA: recombinase family protein [Solirubrobacteraceae bacterium]|nr:recombinase family protein [Solirubrobacteraceae bacterium]